MFDVMKDGEITPIKWDKNNLVPEKSIIIVDESTASIYLWHGTKRGLVDRRIALRQAESLKGHGYTVGKTIVGRDIRTIKEIDQRKIGREPETTELNEDLEAVFAQEFSDAEEFLITFGESDSEAGAKPRPKVKSESKVKTEEPKKEIIKEKSKAVAKPKPKAKPAKEEPVKVKPKPAIKKEPTKVQKAAEVVDKTKGISENTILKRLDAIESKLDSFSEKFEEITGLLKQGGSSGFVNNLDVMKEFMLKKGDLEGAPDYPDRNELIKKKLEDKTKKI